MQITTAACGHGPHNSKQRSGSLQLEPFAHFGDAALRHIDPVPARSGLHRFFPSQTAGSGSLFTYRCHVNACRAQPNPLLKLTRYGMQRKPVVQCLRHCRTPGLHCMPTRAA